MDAQRLPSLETADELGDELLRVLVGSIHVVPPRDDERKLEGAEVRLGDEFRGRLGR